MRAHPRLAILLAAAALQGAQAPDSPPAPAPAAVSPSQPEDPVLADLLRDTFRRNPKIASAGKLREAETMKVAQAGTLPDPVLTLGLQNDGFDRIQIGRMETSYGLVMATQAFPYPGKRRLREEIAQEGVRVAQAREQRIRLDLEAQVRRAYLDLLRLRGRMDLLQKQAEVWKRAEAAARSRYELGLGSQLDLLRAQLGGSRVAAERSLLQGQETSRRVELNRLAGRPADAPLPTTAALADLPLPAAPDPEDAVKAAEEESPELLESRHHARHFQQRVDLSRLDLRPDFSVSAGVMPRGSLPAMWSVSVGISLPVWSRNKQRKAVAENEALQQAQVQDLEQQRQLLSQRTRERVARLRADLDTLALYRSGVLVQADASVQSALGALESGRGTFTSVLEALNGAYGDQSAYLDTLAAAQEELIALRQASLDGGALQVGATAMATTTASTASTPGM
ncbi:MAG TPA: TolC family protein [Holophagaceae bacterium]|nr:TolC family protein [Holophagaceae bacterium]